MTRNNILFIGPKTFGYEKKLIDELARKGAAVYFIKDTFFDTKSLKIFLRIFPKTTHLFLNIFFIRAFKSYEKDFFDKIFVIRGEGLSVSSLQYAATRFRNAKRILYLWDNIRNISLIEEKIPMFDEIFSYDDGDCADNSFFKFRPLFYSDEYVDKGENFELRDESVLFIGTVHSNRTRFLATVAQNNPHLKFKFYLYFRTYLEYVVCLLTDSYFRKLPDPTIIFEPMSSSDVVANVKRHKFVIDTQHPSNNGLTIRTLETIAAGAKLITLNSHVMDYDFYNKSSICVLSASELKISMDFLSAKKHTVSDKFFEKYGISSFLNEILFS